MLLLHMVFQEQPSVIGIKIKQNFKSFSPKEPQMQPIENPWLPKLVIHIEVEEYLYHNQFKEKAEFLSKKCPDWNKGFKASAGWLHRWKTFYGICQLNVNSEKLLQMKWKLHCTVMSWPTQCSIMVIIWIKFSMQMRLVNYKMLLSQTLAKKADREVPGAKKCKEQVVQNTWF